MRKNKIFDFPRLSMLVALAYCLFIGFFLVDSGDFPMGFAHLVYAVVIAGFLQWGWNK